MGAARRAAILADGQGAGFDVHRVTVQQHFTVRISAAGVGPVAENNSCAGSIVGIAGGAADSYSSGRRGTAEELDGGELRLGLADVHGSHIQDIGAAAKLDQAVETAVVAATGVEVDRAHR